MVELLLRNPLLEIPDGGLKVLSEAMDAVSKGRLLSRLLPIRRA